MRFVLAIVAFVAAAVMIAVGIAQRTVFAPPSQVAVSTTVKGDPRYIVIDSTVLNSHPGQQTLAVSGAADVKTQVVAYGRTADVTSWLGDETYTSIGYDDATSVLTTKTVKPKAADSDGGSKPTDSSTTSPTASPTATPTATPTPSASSPATADGKTAEKAGPNPAGSDLWLEEFDGADATLTRMNVPDGISVIISSDGAHAAPNEVRLVWPLDTSTPWSTPLIYGGLGLLVVGLALYLWGLYKLRKSRGPRRKGGPKMPKLPKAPKYKPSKAVETTPKGRRSTRRAMVAVPVVLVGALALSGCTTNLLADPKPTLTKTATPIATDLPKAKDVLPPAVTVSQLELIMKRISTVATAADAKSDSKLLATRFTGPALQLREANYAIRAKKSDQAALPAILASPLKVALPQATSTWPRVVTTVVVPSDTKLAPIALALVQETPRDNYLVNYAVSLEPKAKVPDLAPASIGAPIVRPDSKLLTLPPQDVAAAYGDILMNGDKSKYADLFETDGDTLRTQVGADYKAKMKAAMPATASLTYASQAGPADPIAMATNDSGALVWANLTETDTTKVVEAGAEVNLTDANGPAAALLGAASSKTGIQTTYGYQLAFYVPPAGSDAKITLLGFAQGLVAAKEVQ
ncbi:hypothetical protein [Leifsonia poae]|uniref:hypothetical protein n=1 Tax=Leifsonia poae TaxID=110933 RepID=UPI001CC1851E|nr:hypothetical protein [Leifsonia poae]